MQKRASGDRTLLRPKSFSCDYHFLNELVSIYAYGMPPMEVRLSEVAWVVIEGFWYQNKMHFDGRIG